MAKLKFYDSISLTMYLSNRFQRARFNDEMFPLAPLLFSVYTISITTGSIFCNVQAYADDTKVYINFKLDDAADDALKLNSDFYITEV